MICHYMYHTFILAWLSLNTHLMHTIPIKVLLIYSIHPYSTTTGYAMNDGPYDIQISINDVPVSIYSYP